MGMSAGDTLTTTAWMDRMGMGGGRSGGGTGMADFLRRSVYGQSGKQADEAMQTAGFVVNGKSVFENAKGVFVGMPAAIKIMQDFGTRFHEDATQMSPLLSKIFGVTGEKVAIGMASSGASDQYTNVQQQIQQSPTVNAAQLELSKNWARQMQQLGSSLNDIWTNFGKGVNASLLPFITSLNDVLANTVKWTQANPEVMKYIATFTEIATAVLLVVGPMVLLTGIIGYLSTAGIVGAGFQLLGSAISGAAGPVLGLVAAGYLLYQAWNSDFGGIKEKAKAVTDWIAQEIPKAAKNIQDFGKDIGLINDKGNIEIPEWLKATIGGIGTAILLMKGLKTATILWNLAADANPWVLALSIISIGVMGLITHWDTVKKVIQETPPWVYAVGAAISSALIWMNAMKLATIAWNLLSAANPWLVTLALISGAIILIVDNWTAVSSAIDSAKTVLDNFMGIKSTVIAPGAAYPGDSGNMWVNAANKVNSLKPTAPLPGPRLPAKIVLPSAFKHFAMGTDYAPGGMSLVGEKGPEILNIPGGSQVIPNHKLSDVIPSRGSSGGASYGDIYIDIHPTPNQSPSEIVTEVRKQLGTQTRSNNMSRPMAPNRLVPG